MISDKGFVDLVDNSRPARNQQEHYVGMNLKECFADPRLDVMNFLNEIVMKFSEAISFAPGRPMEAHFQVAESVKNVAEFVAMTASKTGMTKEQSWNSLGQYSRTNGIINDLISQQLERDEGIFVPQDAIMVTVGAQEAIAVVLTGLFDASQDILLAGNPTYIGITGLARILGIRIAPVQSGEMGLDPAAVERTVNDCSKWGRPRAIYDIPDFNNPLGTYMPLDRRRRLLDLCRHHGILLIEDNPYGMFLYEGEKLPTLKALDREHVVLYIGSFAKTLFPGLRLGYLVADQKLANNQFLAQELSKVKSLLTVNTPPLLQAMVAEILIRNQCSLKAIIAPKAAGYRRNRDVMIDSLATNFSDMQDLVCWNSPCGGFFLTVNLPFPFGVAELQQCAAEYGVIVGPLQFFALAPGFESRIRLSFSYVDENGIRTGIQRLACFVREQCKVHGIRN